MLLRLVAWFLGHLYTTLAWSYDAVAALVSLGHWRAWVYTALDDLPGPRVLELGHGPGHLLHALTARGMWAVGIDASWPMSRRARRRGASPLAHARAQRLPFRDQSFDQVVATFPPSFIFEETTLREVHRVLRPGGRLIVLLGARLSSRSLPAVLLQWIYHLTGQDTPGTPETLLRPFERASFTPRLLWREGQGARLLYLIADCKKTTSLSFHAKW